MTMIYTVALYLNLMLYEISLGFEDFLFHPKTVGMLKTVRCKMCIINLKFSSKSSRNMAESTFKASNVVWLQNLKIRINLWPTFL